MKIRSAEFAIVPTWVLGLPAVRGNATRIAVYVAVRVAAYEQPDHEWRSDRQLAVYLGEMVGFSDEVVRKHLSALRMCGAITGEPGALFLPSDPPKSGSPTGSVATQTGDVGSVATQTGSVATHSPPYKNQENQSRGSAQGQPSDSEPKKGASSPTRRRRDLLWEAMLDACSIGPDGITDMARGAYNKAAKDLRELGVTPDEVVLRARRFRQRWPDVSLTPTALARRWPELEHQPGRSNGAVGSTTTMAKSLSELFANDPIYHCHEKP